MNKIDFKKTIPAYKAKHSEFSKIKVPAMQYLMIDGHGAPDGSEFADAVQALYPVAYKLKFMSKADLKKDYVVPPLEGLWWAENMEVFTTGRDKSKWDWTVMLMVPDWITKQMFNKVKEKVAADKQLKRLDKMRLEALNEGECVQTLHIGSFDDEGPVIEKMHKEFIPSNNLKIIGKHHEIYLSDFRKVSPEKLRTILRQPVQS